MTHKIRLPATFYWDHVDRDLPGGTVIKQTKRYIDVELSDDDLNEIESDARHYATGYEYWSDYRGLVMSARATLRRIREYRDQHEMA